MILYINLLDALTTPGSDVLLIHDLESARIRELVPINCLLIFSYPNGVSSNYVSKLECARHDFG